MNSYLYRKLSQLNANLSDLQSVVKTRKALEAKLDEVKESEKIARDKVDVEEAKELLSLTNQIEGTTYYLDEDSFEVVEEKKVEIDDVVEPTSLPAEPVSVPEQHLTSEGDMFTTVVPSVSEIMPQ